LASLASLALLVLATVVVVEAGVVPAIGFEWELGTVHAQPIKPRWKIFGYTDVHATAPFCKAIVHSMNDRVDGMWTETLDYKPSEDVLDLEFVIGGPIGHPLNQPVEFKAVVDSMVTHFNANVDPATGQWKEKNHRLLHIPDRAADLEATKVKLKNGLINIMGGQAKVAVRGSPQMTLGIPMGRVLAVLTASSIAPGLWVNQKEAFTAELTKVALVAHLTDSGKGFLAVLARLFQALYNKQSQYIKQGTGLLCRTDLAQYYHNLPHEDQALMAGAKLFKDFFTPLAQAIWHVALDDNTKMLGKDGTVTAETDYPAELNGAKLRDLKVSEWLAKITAGTDVFKGGSDSLGKLDYANGLVVVEFRDCGHGLTAAEFAAFAVAKYAWAAKLVL